ncbi:carboxyl transferase domain-containing protein [Skermania piniformis]|nr:carboxyl transferase domain-containing protein [Skermania piniformis]
MQATVVAVPVAVGDRVRQGTVLVVLDSMKMEHVISAATEAEVTWIGIGAGQVVDAGEKLIELDERPVEVEYRPEPAPLDLNGIPGPLQALRDRLAVVLDEHRPRAVQSRHELGHRTARENIDHLCDPDSFIEYGALVVAAQRQRRSMSDLISHTPADGLVAGIGQVNGERFGPDRSRCVVLAYDYTVLAGTQGVLNHRKADRMFAVAGQERLPVVLFAEGGGGRPGDTDTTQVSGLDVETFYTYGRLSGVVPRVGIAAGRCFAGNAALLGTSDVVIATQDASIGMAGPAMIEGGGLGSYTPEEIGPADVQAEVGVIDVLVASEAHAVQIAQQYLGYFQGPIADFSCSDQRVLRHLVPENRRRRYAVRDIIAELADLDSVLELRAEFGVAVVTALMRIEGKPMGVIASNPEHLGGAIDADAADKLARFLQLCDAFGLPIVSLCDTPGFMVGPDSEESGAVRRMSRLFVVGSHLTVPLCAIVLRKGYGLGALAMAGGSFRAPVATVAWPTGEIGGMGLEGAVRLAFRGELEAIEDPDERARYFDKLVALAYEQGQVTNAASVFELDAVIDPADTRGWIIRTLASAAPGTRTGRYIDTW